MKIRNIALSVLVLSLLAACSFDKQRIDYKSAVSQVPPLEIPPDLTTIAASDQFSIPGADGTTAANYSDYSKAVAGQNAKGSNSTEVLPVLTKRHMERDGMNHWVVVEDKAENVWPGIKAFWQQLGFRITVENPSAGVMETDWLENQGNVPRSYVRRIAGNGKAVDTLSSEGIRDQYVTRIERSKDGLSTEIHIRRQVMQETQSGNRKEIKWLPHENDPEIEIAVLQMLLDKLVTGSPVTPKAAKLATTPANAIPLVPAVEPVAVSIQLKDSTTGKVIQINEPFDRSWRRVGLALESAHIVVSDKDRSKGIYFVAPAPDKSKKDNKKQQADLQVSVREVNGGSEVSVVGPNGKNDADSARLIEVLNQNMGSNPVPDARPLPDEKSAPRSGDAVRPPR
jgi:outer membrane protein assembly factor BamC